MTMVVFTGPGHDKDGLAIVRADLEEACKKVGFSPVKVVRPGVNLLVASRTDTVKAKSAEKMGVQVVTYPVFLDMLEMMGATVTRSGKSPDKYVDGEDKKFAPAGQYGGGL